MAEGDNIIVSSDSAYNDGAHVVVCNYFPLLDKNIVSHSLMAGDMKIVNPATIMLFALALTICIQGRVRDCNISEKNKFVDQCGDGLDGGIVPWIVYNP
ncbi:hypothetical protein MJO52_19730 [Microbulbifer variabilis]|uniref:Uncharacterized protein n=1 Tax=Microbulbifer variabilis TaxID=266805 RepID=A0ABY4VAE6_9GAMM|nr:hypothetical protein [Microbulbifer variabilis]USD21266.1 hypothetical protein MJO52_19730 [Microbulbifer variabilis]